MMSRCDVTHHYLSVGVVFAEPVEDDVSWDSNHTEDAAVRTPADHLDGEGVFFYQVCRPPVTRLGFVEDLGGLYLIQHLESDWMRRQSWRNQEDVNVNKRPTEKWSHAELSLQTDPSLLNKLRQWLDNMFFNDNYCSETGRLSLDQWTFLNF